ncbi:MAG: septum formation protein Maf [Deltaproteobacteria bacterium]|nr:septum formation protein Maf [Deltaproteobacteria bacterium]
MTSVATDYIRLVLASASPRRKSLLEAAGIAFEIVESGIDEVRLDGEGGADFALRMAREKVLNVSTRVPDALVLAADTIVECDGRILGKPIDAAEACSMLQTLSGNTHTVVTAFAIASAGAISESAPILSRVTFRPLSVEEIADYVATGQPLDKAGSYGIQDAGAGFITQVEGERDNVMGLPVREVLEALRRHGIVTSPVKSSE